MLRLGTVVGLVLGLKLLLAVVCKLRLLVGTEEVDLGLASVSTWPEVGTTGTGMSEL